jgi:DNA-directed RNA polymerase specialized sigma24 family protein
VHVSAQEVPREASIVAPFVFSRLLHWLDDGVDSHGERYLEIHRRLVSYFDRHNRLRADDLADETFRRIAGVLEQDGAIDTSPPARYCYVVAKGVLLEDVASERRHISAVGIGPGIAARPASMASPWGPSAGERPGNCFDRFLRELRTEERELVIGYYRDAPGGRAKHRRRMAERMGVSLGALSIRAVRIREALMKRVTSCWGEQRKM